MPKKVLVFVCDTATSTCPRCTTITWMLDNGFLERPQHGDLRDLILRPIIRRTRWWSVPAIC